MADDIELLQGTLDLLVLKVLSWGRMHGYTIMARLREATGSVLHLEDAALYPALHRLEARGLIESSWGLSENNRRARFYTLSAKGKKALAGQAKSWQRYVAMVAQVLESRG